MEEQGLRFEIPYRKGHSSDDDTKLQAQLLNILTKAFDETELRVYNNKNNKVKNFKERKKSGKTRITTKPTLTPTSIDNNARR
jgi:hypothetical protein